MSCCCFQDIIGVSLEETQLLTSNQLYNEILFNSNINSNFTIYSSNALSNFIQPQLDERSNLIYRDNDLNTIVKLTSKNPFYPAYGAQKELRFHNADNEYKTKLNQKGEIEIYHPLQEIPTGYSAGWWNIHDKLSGMIQEEIGLRFDVVNLQVATGTGTITNEAQATAAAIASGAGLVGLGGLTGAAATTIAGGDYGTVALGIAGGTLFSVLGYLSYQAQVGCNLSNQGFLNQFSNVNSNMSNANLLLTSNLYSISRAQGFINCNILSQQYINDLKISSLNLNNGNITQLNNINGNTGIFATISTTNNTNEAIPSKNNFGGLGDKIIIKTGSSLLYPYSIGIENKALWISGDDNINFYNRGNKSLSLTSNKDTEIYGELLCNSNIKLNQINISNIFVASNVLNTTSNSLYNFTINSSNINSNLTYTSSNILSNNIYNSSNINSNFTYNSSNINSNTSYNFYNINSNYTYNSSNILSNNIYNSSNINSNFTYTSVNSPNVSKKYGFQATCSTSIVMPDALTYYKYDIDLRNYTRTKTVANPNTPYRIFKIHIFLASAYFEYFSSVPDVLSYEIYMSNESQNGGGGGYAGINICALGSPQNYNLNSILPNVLSLLRTGDFNYLSVICRYSGALFNIIIEDLIN